jgi:septal ring factor EnvC (AmiA/AmiB activator)
MKQYFKFFALVLVVFVMASCNQQEKQLQQEVATLNEELEQLRQESLEKEENINMFFESMAQIRDNLTEIKVKQNMITEETRGQDQLGQDVRKQIESDLEAISNLMEDNRRRLAELNRQLRNSNVKITEFESMVASLTSEIEEKNIEIAMLRDSMHEMNISNVALAETIERLEVENTEKLQEIEEKTEQLNTAYFTYGTRRDLEEKVIIEKSGGVLGIGRTFLVNSNINQDYFTRLNITQVDKLLVPGKNPRLISKHPDGSYVVKSLEEEGAEIIIEDPAEFWSTTRYLVVSID